MRARSTLSGMLGRLRTRIGLKLAVPAAALDDLSPLDPQTPLAGLSDRHWRQSWQRLSH